MLMPKVSVLIVTKYLDSLLLKAAKSVTELDYNSFELILCHEIANEEKEKAVRKICKDIKLVLKKIPASKGISFNRNQSLKYAKGKYVAFTDSDCEVPQDWLTKHVELYEKEKKANPNIGALQAGVFIPNSTYLGNCISYMGFPAGGNVGFANVFNVDLSGYTTQISTCNTFAELKRIQEVGGFDDRLARIVDKELALRLLNKGYKIKYVYNPVQHVDNKSFIGLLKKSYVKGQIGYDFLKIHPDLSKEYTVLRSTSFLKIVGAVPGFKKIVVLSLIILSYVFSGFGYLSRLLGR